MAFTEQDKHISLIEKIYLTRKIWNVEEPPPAGWRYATGEEISAYIHTNSPRVFSLNETWITENDSYYYMYTFKFKRPKGTKLYRFYTLEGDEVYSAWDEPCDLNVTLIVRSS